MWGAHANARHCVVECVSVRKIGNLIVLFILEEHDSTIACDQQQEPAKETKK